MSLEKQYAIESPQGMLQSLNIDMLRNSCPASIAQFSPDGFLINLLGAQPANGIIQVRDEFWHLGQPASV